MAALPQADLAPAPQSPPFLSHRWSLPLGSAAGVPVRLHCAVSAFAVYMAASLLLQPALPRRSEVYLALRPRL